MAPEVTRAGTILAVADVERSLAFYRDMLGFELEATYDDPPYATLAAPVRGCRWPSRATPPRTARACRWSRRADPSRLAAILVLEVEDCLGAHRELSAAGVRFLAEPYSPPWGGHRCFAVDPDGNLSSWSSRHEGRAARRARRRSRSAAVARPGARPTIATRSCA